MPKELPNHGQGTVSIVEASNLSKVRYSINNTMERRGEVLFRTPLALSLSASIYLFLKC
jgi:hypothetical protein